jgi:hypothetical protein
MTRNFRAVSAVLFGVVLFLPPQYLYSQQSILQMSFFAPAAIRTLNTSLVPTIVEAEHLPYLKEVAKETSAAITPFQPNSSDLLIQQAEERFRNGKRAFQDRDFDHARTEFDAATERRCRAIASALAK